MIPKFHDLNFAPKFCCLVALPRRCLQKYNFRILSTLPKYKPALYDDEVNFGLLVMPDGN